MTVNGNGRDTLTLMLQCRRSQATRETYRRHLVYFFREMTDGPPTKETVEAFLKMPRSEAMEMVLNYKALLLERGLAEWTVNGSLSAVKAPVNFARRIGQCEYDLADVTRERVRPHRDMTGLTPEQMRQVLTVPERGTVRGRRDYAILVLLWENALRRGEVVKLNVGDFDPQARTLAILGKGRGTQRGEYVYLSERAACTITEWLEVRGEVEPQDPLFIATNNRHRGHRLTGETIRATVTQACREAGILKQMSPHRIRHSSITAALEATGGDVVVVPALQG